MFDLVGVFLYLSFVGNFTHLKKGIEVLAVEQLLNDYIEATPPIGVEGLDYPTIYELWNGEWSEYPHTYHDIYDLLASYRHKREGLNAPDAVVVATSGWAAPLGDDGEMPNCAPSQHPDRLRCVVYNAFEVGHGGFVSRVAIHRPEGVEISNDYGTATGALADSLIVTALTLWGKRYTSNLLTWWGSVDKQTVSADMRKGIAQRLTKMVEMLSGESEGE